jgi:hypothetical protein
LDHKVQQGRRALPAMQDQLARAGRQDLKAHRARAETQVLRVKPARPAHKDPPDLQAQPDPQAQPVPQDLLVLKVHKARPVLRVPPDRRDRRATPASIRPTRHLTP